MTTTWKKVAQTMHNTAVRLGYEWGCDPAKGSIDSVSVEIDSECDKWCQKLSNNLDGTINPPESARPWILKRLAYASAFATCLSKDKKRKQTIPDYGPEIAYVLLIDIWHEGKFGVN